MQLFDLGPRDRALAAYRGEQVIYMGGPGFTGDDGLHRRLRRDWTEVDCHRPVVWWGLRDTIAIYSRHRSSCH